MPAGYQAFGSAAGYVGSAPFQPIDLSGLVAWFRADKGLTLNGSNVSAWADQSGVGDSGRNLAQGNSALQPAFTASDAAYNNRPTVGFAGLELLVSGAWSANLPVPSTRMVVGHGANDLTNNYFMDSIQGGNQHALIASSSGFSDVFDGATLTDNTATPDTPNVFVIVDNGASTKIYRSAHTVRKTGNAGANANWTGVTVGNTAGGGSFALTGSIAEIAEWDRALSATEIALLMDYAGARYGISIGA